MSHLTLETLARLIDEAPDPTEAGHLDICEQCRDELEAMRADAAALQLLPDPKPSDAQWLRLEQRLQHEGLMRGRSQWHFGVLRAAAAVIIFVLGGVSATLLIRQSRNMSVAANEMRTPVVTQQPLAVINPAAPRAVTVDASAPAPAATPVTREPARTAEEAVTRLRTAENDYLAALTRYTELAGRVDEGDPLARLAALESIVATTRAALGRAPADPVINGYHLTAVAQRDAVLRQLNASGQTWY